MIVESSSKRQDIYEGTISKELQDQFDFATNLKETGVDPTVTVESNVATDLADRVAKLLDVPIAERLRHLLTEGRTEIAALRIAEEVASGKYPVSSVNQAEAAIRIGLAIVTDGVTVAPIQGISAVNIKQNLNGSSYLSVQFAGPIRSAGGTESAFTLVIADHVRKTLGLEKYSAMSFDDEPSRFVEELRVYERDVGNFQYKISDEDVRRTLDNLPVEIDGVWTDNYEVVVHRDMHRISTNRLRGGALRVLNDGVVGKSKKMLKLLRELGIDDWNWLSQLSGGKQQGTDETKATSSHFDDVISGRPVLSMPGRTGGFRIRYGRAPNTGIHAVGIHPTVSALLNYPIVTGTQVKVDMPGKAASVAFVDTIDTPIVRLHNGAVIHVKDVEHALALAPDLESIIYLGDILVSYGDFLENNTKLVPSAYVEEWWSQELRTLLNKMYTTLDKAEESLGVKTSFLERLISDPTYTPSFADAITLSEKIGVPLHPKYLLYWDQLTPEQILNLRQAFRMSKKEGEEGFLGKKNGSSILLAPVSVKPILETLGAEHSCVDHDIVILVDTSAQIISRCLALDTLEEAVQTWTNSLELVSALAHLPIRAKSSTFVGVRVGRPEKAMPRKMRPPVQGLFPVGKSSGLSRDILNTLHMDSLVIELANLDCPECGYRAFSAKCPICRRATQQFKVCVDCGSKYHDTTRVTCTKCKGKLKLSSLFSYPIKQELKTAAARVQYNPVKPLKGVLGLTNETKIPERLEKVLLRQKYDLSVYRDGTIRYDLTNVPLTHFTPKQIHVSIVKLNELGYTHDIKGDPLENEDQTLELFSQDIVIPFEAGTFLIAVSKYIDDLLLHYYLSETPYYQINNLEDVLGQLVVGLAPHTSVGIVGRIIGYTNAQACFASPYWHSAKRRDCDGDGDSIILLMDVLLNFSRKFLPSIIGGLMDAPLLIQPLILPKEVQRQAHHMDVTSCYPLEFYKQTLDKQSPTSVEPIMDIIKHRLGTREQFEHFGFTHNTSSITVKQSRSSYSTLVTLTEKLDRQIELAQKIKAVNPDEVVRSVLRTHLLPDIIGNTKAFTSQKFRCKKCGSKFRRMPIRGNCLNCGSDLQPSVTRGSVEKYLQLGLKLSQKYNVGVYLQSRFLMAAEELSTLFKAEGYQLDMKDYLTQDTVTYNDLDNHHQDDLQDMHKEEKSYPKASKQLEEHQTTL
jgi:DNA polymerase II large subunit